MTKDDADLILDWYYYWITKDVPDLILDWYHYWMTKDDPVLNPGLVSSLDD